MYWEKKIGTCPNAQYAEVLEEIGTILWKGKESADADRLTFYHYVLIHDIIPALDNAIHELIAQPEHILFTGTIGWVYTQMYTPVIPHKDVLEFMGVNYKQTVKPARAFDCQRHAKN